MKTNKVTLRVNRGDVDQVQVNVTTQVNAKQIRKITHNGREHWVLPSYTLPANVIMNGGLYPASEIDAHYQGLEGTLAPLGHPTVDGKFVSAFSPEGINVGYAGAFNRNVKKSGNRVYLEKWVDIEVAGRTEQGRELLERVEALEKGEDVPPIHTSVAVFLQEIEPNEEQKAAGAEWVAKINGMDHDAILLNEVGAATPEQGVGLMVNADQAKPLAANSGALVGESYREREQRLDRAAKERFAPGGDDYAWIADFTDTQAIIVRNGGVAEVYGYTTEGGKIVFGDSGAAVVRQESWVAMIANSVKKIFNHQARPDKTMEGDMPLTPEEKAGLVTDVGAAVAANVAEQLKPLTDAVAALQANQTALSDSLTANARAEEVEKRKAVAEKHGEVVANALSGDALEAMYKSLGTAAPLAGNSGQEQAETGAPDPATYFGGK
ncbi:hypothetical protein [Eoetvoesiella caeni]|uniref:Gp7 n=1 Tax=Eoetvoesiella caeni TaxID=645616 RepID=A0A366HBX9_9BURK|nr:hypothetical protein [Eoetvoesiella caeni]MCI2809382.1 hypothetical protein [Eoetvoesiella caeni]NYT54523.1 hypothetical protein [Eoetvoesiella caeni]RBP39287.1 hypothetical protein DFR37_10578 [Eoetvoesiella caeni]